MDAQYINAVIKSVKNVFETIAAESFSHGKPSLKQDKIPAHDISGAIEFSGEVTGCVVVSLSRDIALHLASAMLDDEITDFDEECIDAIGEIASMAAGNAKQDFPKQNVTFSAPEVIIGEKEIAYPDDIPAVSMPCETSKGPLTVDIALKEK